ncbi:type II toxin-antitoxin system VapB family antitoxin [Dactylosporangium sp. AC04546]|uniref:type II toxin-antitoxin system VapB family antitoxin n=1 Tax=Dactylosporangium sp. AC04546 TaxID=2862460 RepID=UPI001EDE3BB5|nr:type II toxin-antitoxin system VapB family antitoxin [Dactylosporangium sp. AC04546]WVK81735.1 type II toxin-antitoxin system VapB family antitoxin [Dactylosporangium sp. AC04546]
MTETVITADTDSETDAVNPDETPAEQDETPIDEELLAEAGRGLGTTSRNEILNGVLRDYVERKRQQRREALERVRKLADEGAFDFDRIDEVDQ